MCGVIVTRMLDNNSHIHSDENKVTRVERVTLLHTSPNFHLTVPVYYFSMIYEPGSKPP